MTDIPGSATDALRRAGELPPLPRTPLQDAVQGFDLSVKPDGVTAEGSKDLGHNIAVSGAVKKSFVQRGVDWWVGVSWRPKK